MLYMYYNYIVDVKERNCYVKCGEKESFEVKVSVCIGGVGLLLGWILGGVCSLCFCRGFC